MDKFHYFSSPVTDIALPEKFTYPFHYTPHPLVVKATEEVQAYIHTRKDWRKDLKQGKMFGVLVVRTKEGEVGFLAAFSGILAGKNLHTYFVPPIYDLQQPKGFFQPEEKKISAINLKIRKLQKAPAYTEYKNKLAEAIRLSEESIREAKEQQKIARQHREARRQSNPTDAELAAMIRESQFQKAELKRLKQQWKERIDALQKEASAYEAIIEQLKTERKTRSAALQQLLFEQFRILNARGEIRDLCDIFKETEQKVPPAGAGECAAPKLLQYAYLNGLQPLAMAEFWWGYTSKMELRRHGYYYPACKSKCEPILNHMLQGLEVEANPLAENIHGNTELNILWEDEWLVIINKPAGMLSVPGKMNVDSVYSRMKSRYPDATGPMIVHRLDMATSGLLLIAKTKHVHQNLQAQFKNRIVKKRYIALLDGNVATDEGTIDLPLCANPEDRPRQTVNATYGKPAVTHYKVLERTRKHTRVAFYPQTGRTHQLRVHAAHPEGLNAPIIGDELYGKKSTRLFLHAESLEFTHPATGEVIEIVMNGEF